MTSAMLGVAIVVESGKIGVSQASRLEIAKFGSRLGAAISEFWH